MTTKKETAVHEHEDRILAKKAQKRLDEMDENDLIDFDEATRLAGWDGADSLSSEDERESTDLL